MDTHTAPATLPAQPPAEEGRPHPGLGVYLATAAGTFLITTLELVLLAAHGPAALLVPLMLVQFGLAALFYQGLWYEEMAYKLTFAIGLLFGLVTLGGLAVLLQLGRLPQ